MIAGPAGRTGRLLSGRLLTGEAIERLVTMGGSRALAAGLGFLSTILIARALEPASLGLWSMALAVQGLALHLGEAGLRSVATAEVARTPDLAGTYLRRTLCLRLAISTVVIGLGSGLAWWLALGDWRLTALVLSSLWPIALQLDWLPLAMGRNCLAAALLLARPLMFLGLLVLVPSLSPMTLGCVFLGAWWLAAAVTWPSVMPTSPAPKAGLAIPALLRLALPVAAVTAASQLLLSLDLLLVGASLGAAEAAQYYLASAVLVAGLVVVNGLGQSALARMGARAADPGVFRAALAADLKLALGVALILALAIAAVAPFLLPLAFGSAYAPAASVALWLLPWFVAQHAATTLTAAMTAARLGRRLLLANAWMIAALAPGLLAAWLAQSLVAFALARGLAEIVRVTALVAFLPADLRPFRRSAMALNGPHPSSPRSRPRRSAAR